ncbi:MAG TPA: hypothetical protein VFB45_12445 [Pseudolabrys sp.]|nr:hypothetical protein [Pseudolabrys sp.]
MRRIARIFWVTLALLFLLEAWLWDHLEPLVARVVNLVPWGRFKEHLVRVLEDLPPWAALIAFIIPVIVLLPLKACEVWFIATHRWVPAVLVLILAKLLGLGITAFIFEATRGRLLQMQWFARLYAWFIWARDWAHQQVEPIKEKIRSYMWLLRPGRAGRFMRRWMRLRRRLQRAA